MYIKTLNMTHTTDAKIAKRIKISQTLIISPPPLSP
jgi:hypothetical protein